MKYALVIATRSPHRLLRMKLAFASAQLVLVLPLGKVTEIMTGTELR